MVGEPAAAVCKSHSSDIIDVLEDMKEKAEAEMKDLRNEETGSQHLICVHVFPLFRQDEQPRACRSPTITG